MDPAPRPETTDPDRVRLRPGLSVVTREPGVLQVGLDAPLRLLIGDDPDVRRLLDALRRPPGLATRTPLRTSARRALLALQQQGLLVAHDGGGDTDDAEATLAWHGSAAPERVRRRVGAVVSVDATAVIVGRVDALLRGYGCRGVPSGSAREGRGAPVVLVVREGLVPREALDPLVREGRTHLALALGPGVLEIGPFVAPGRTACQRCVDAHAATGDPRRSLVLALAARERAGAVDPALGALGLAWAVRDLVTHLEGDRPASWSASIRVDPSLTTRRRVWARHPHCGCAWGDGVGAA